jgi:multiple sugar transport system ATP-binding protein
MTVRENMAFSLTLAKAPKAVMEQKVGRAADILGLSQLLDRYPRQLSGGQRQRVAMGRAIVRDPQVFLFDEPLSNLDAKLRVQMRGEIKDLHQRLRTTTVYVTHDQIEAMTMADKIVVMQGGHVEQIGTPLDLYDRPANVFFAVGDLSLPLPTTRGASEGAKMVYGIRPEHWRLDDAGIAATVKLVEPTGSETQVVVEFADHRVVCAFRERVTARPGEVLHITPDPAAAHLFDDATGKRLA